MAASRIISARAILLCIGTGDVQVNDDGIITWKPLLALLVIREGNPPLPVDHIVKGRLFSMIRENAVDQTTELYMIWDTTKSMSR